MAADRGAAARVAVVGATGYTGAELLRLLFAHPGAEVVRVYGHGKAGQPLARALPSLAGMTELEVEAFDEASLDPRLDAAFCALPHGASAPTVAALRRRGVLVLDLSADFRLEDLAVYERWYGEHGAKELVGSAVYGLPELHRARLRTADLIAVPGCYPTASILALAPLLSEGLVEAEGIVIDAKSGASGAGRTPGPATHLPEAAEGIRAYKSAGLHRHTPEIEQELSRAAGKPLRVTFTPHLVPMSRGILATVYAEARPGVDAARLTEAARARYAGSPSVVVLDPGGHPDTAWVRGSNRVQLAYALDARTGRVVGQAVLDNLVKGAAGQAIQCLNVRRGAPEGEGLGLAPLWP